MEIPNILICTLAPAIIGGSIIIYSCLLRMAGLISQDERRQGKE